MTSYGERLLLFSTKDAAQVTPGTLVHQSKMHFVAHQVRLSRPHLLGAAQQQGKGGCLKSQRTLLGAAQARGGEGQGVKALCHST